MLAPLAHAALSLAAQLGVLLLIAPSLCCDLQALSSIFHLKKWMLFVASFSCFSC